MRQIVWILLLISGICIFCTCSESNAIDPDKEIQYCIDKALLTLDTGFEEGFMPRNIKKGEQSWNVSRLSNWTSGYWPGILWYLYEYTQDEIWLQQAKKYTNFLEPNQETFYNMQDMGLTVYLSFGNGYKLTGNPYYKEVLLKSAEKLAELFNQNDSHPHCNNPFSEFRVENHNSIINSIMNLNLLFWAGKNGRPDIFEIALNHADAHVNKTLFSQNHETSVTAKRAYAAHSQPQTSYLQARHSYFWSKGLCWSLYGYTMTYRETGEPRFLDEAQSLANFFIDNLPIDNIPYWSFSSDYPIEGIKDASAAAIAASALLELSSLTENLELKDTYFDSAQAMLKTLSSRMYKSRKTNHAFLLHSVGYISNFTELDVSIIYADYYYLEALIRYRDIINKSGNLLTKR